MAGEHFDDDQTSPLIDLSQSPKVSHYAIVRKIGSGGMGEVYLAEDTELNRKVALKFLSSHLCQDADCRARFKREAQAAARLNHPNIVTIHEVSEFNGRPFFAMEHVEGQSLRDAIKAKELSIERVIDLAIQICEGLHKAHLSGIVHRDVKPANILIDADGRVKILDFGLAVVQGCDHLTKAGSTLGTIGYMSPEQIRGEQVDQRSDIFSLGVVLYELIAGRPPFRGDNDTVTSRKITDSEPEPLARYKAGVSEELQRIVSKSLAKDKVLRYQHADELLTDIRRIAGITFESGFLSAKLPVLAVLPFDNLGPADQEYFADGMTEEIITLLAGIKGIGVVSRTSVMKYKTGQRHLRQIAAELRVDYVVEGSVLWARSKDADRVRINVQFIKVSDDRHLWANRFDRNLDDIFSLQSEIAQKVVHALDSTLLSVESPVVTNIPTTNSEAYDYYLRGLMQWTPSRTSTLACIDLFENAAHLDPSFVKAHCRLVALNALMYFWQYDTSPDRLSKAKEALGKLTALAAGSLDAFIAQGDFYYWGLRDYDRALHCYCSASRLEPANKRLSRSIGLIKRRQGFLDEAVVLLTECASFDPLNPLTFNELGLTCMAAKSYFRAEECLRKAVFLGPDFALHHLSLAQLYIAQSGDIGKARQVVQQAPAHLDFSDFLSYLDLLEGSWLSADRHLPKSAQEAWEGDVTEYYWRKAWVKLLAGQTDEAKNYFDSLRMTGEKAIVKNPSAFFGYVWVAVGDAGLGQKDEAIRFAQKASEIMPLDRDRYGDGPRVLFYLSIAYALVGDIDTAIDHLDQLLTVSGFYSIHTVRLEPYWSALRQSPRYEWLMKKHAT